ncbi:hypothetical protein [Amycolatopsis anabasis]|uniref:hypothetical protein n=1 Tax=Amycolatopsis anabasis TaxID=1840409 RepID=UPI00131DBEFE|nr:hypothetical protein [Amycolatopsis anabasis]
MSAPSVLDEIPDEGQLSGTTFLADLDKFGDPIEFGLSVTVDDRPSGASYRAGSRSGPTPDDLAGSRNVRHRRSPIFGQLPTPFFDEAADNPGTDVFLTHFPGGQVSQFSGESFFQD